MTRSRIARRTTTTVPAPETTTPDQPPLTRADFDHAIAVLGRLFSFSQARGSNPLEDAEMSRFISRLELYRDWWAAPNGMTSIINQAGAAAALDLIATLEEEVTKWRGYSRRNEERAKKAQRELEHIKTTRRPR